MAYLKFLNTQTMIPCTVTPNGNVITLMFPAGATPVYNVDGFRLYLDREGTMDIGGDYYLGYRTIYRNDDVTVTYNGYQLSCDGSVYVPPEPVPDPEPVPPYIPTLEEIREQKVQAMNTIQQAMITTGVDVTLSDGTTEHFTLTGQDQASLTGLQTQVLAGAEQLPWHTSDEDKHCKFYSNADMTLIVSAAMQYVIWHVSYFRDLRIYIRSLTDKEAVEAVTYGMDLPEAYQSDPLKAMLTGGTA